MPPPRSVEPGQWNVSKCLDLSRCDLLWEKQGPARIGGDKGVADVKVNGLEFVTGETEKTGNSNDAAGRGEVKKAKKFFYV